MVAGHLFNSRFLFCFLLFVSISRQQFVIQAVDGWVRVLEYTGRDTSTYNTILLASQDHSISTNPLLLIVKCCGRLWLGHISFEYHLLCFRGGNRRVPLLCFFYLNQFSMTNALQGSIGGTLNKLWTRATHPGGSCRLVSPLDCGIRGVLLISTTRDTPPPTLTFSVSTFCLFSWDIWRRTRSIKRHYTRRRLVVLAFIPHTSPRPSVLSRVCVLLCEGLIARLWLFDTGGVNCNLVYNCISFSLLLFMYLSSLLIAQ